MAFLPSFISNGDLPATRCAQSRTVSSNSASGTTRFTIPSSRASSAVMLSPSIISSLAFIRPMFR